MVERARTAHSDADARDLGAIQRTLRDDPHAFNEIVERYTPLVFSLAHRYLSKTEDAEDAAQDIFLKVFDALPRFRLSNRFYPWLYTIALNHIRSAAARSSRRRSRHTIEFSDTNASHATSLQQPEHELLARESERIAQAAIDRLPQRYRDVFVLRQLEGIAVAEVAEILGIPEGTVKTNLHRARKELAQFIAHEGWP